MQEVLKRLADLRALSGNAQLSYLECVKSPLLREVLEYTMDTQKKYKITEKKYDKAMLPLFNTNLISLDMNQPLTIELWEKFKSELDYLASIKSATDEDVQRVKNIIEPCVERDFLKMVLFKDLRLGMDRKKVQKVYPDFCVTYPYMGCKPFSMEDLKRIPFPAYAQTKMDGSYCNIIVGDKVEYVSRQSKPQKMQGTLDNEFLKIDLPEKYVFTGEALVWNKERTKPLPRKLGNGILRREEKTQDEIDRIFYVCWDCLPYKNFVEKHYDIPYTERFERLCHFFEQADTSKLKTVNTWVVNSVEEAMAKFQEQYELGEEGVVIKAFNQKWVDGKPTGQVKIKAEKSCELRMVGFIEGKGAYSGMCGAIRCVSEDDLIEVFIKPRTQADGIELWNNQDKYYHKILEVKFNEVISSESKDKYSLYLPVFVEIRDDKNVADDFEYIKNL